MSNVPKKDLLSYLLITCGPKDDGKIRLMATDAAEGMQICRHAVVHSSSDGWSKRVSALFVGVFDSRTLEFLREYDRHIVSMLAEGKGSIWLTPHGLQVRMLKSQG